ncbi:hypothetical protein SEA_STROSAHL_92 [Gordonia phage Strosahl]|uniref:Uncharacterized protein n=2 Tax=Soupsvirus strosahl TaxID=2560510 RepID=A0A1B3B1C3_9CAUD|nr:hypothetical protein BIZ67_gp018 [Gordonia phage Remus]YP_009596293.1 hypothetical protein FDH03_gp018 [Gordonia phage Strosahl]QFP95156.1 hypothetical protein SEA_MINECRAFTSTEVE_92 [Gordonia phage MinecraftSteve]QWS67872.1 hypothetical protein SEA_DEKHOCKEY33_93 [Gordonia phage DekHockey33]QZD98736.1 hypothetical protein SEA_LOOPER_88 [Gordonia phage Looper]WIC40184.1 hypothetical protein SEA_BATTLESHIP_94 [Gordonia phage Battleship]AOE44696.1 hypothetical protein SEA_REMUS_92 [Gordonia p
MSASSNIQYSKACLDTALGEIRRLKLLLEESATDNGDQHAVELIDHTVEQILKHTSDARDYL